MGVMEMAKDGTNRGDTRPGTGRKPKVLTEKISEGKAAAVLMEPVSLEGAEVPPVKDFLKSPQKRGRERKQWKVPKKRQWGLQKLGIGKDLARQRSYMGNRYQWVVTKTCVVRAISKEKLLQAGLVSCYDYYMERHALKLC